METIELRLATDRDGLAVHRVADRDTRPLPPGPHLIAVRDGSVDAVLSLTTGEAVADPFRSTAELVELLHLHARTVTVPAPPPASATPVPRPRLRPATT
jgi:hypothetical protein